MKRLFLAASLFTLPFTTQAVGIFIEGQGGIVSSFDVDTKIIESTVEAGDVSASLDNEGIVYGAEIGITGFEKHDVIRLGLSWLRTDTEFDKATIRFTGGTVVEAFSQSLSASESKELLGLDFDNEVDIVTANIYYDFPVEMKWKPYIGLGIGLADIENAEDKETAYTFIGGVRYEISDSFNIGARYQYISIDGPTDELEIEYDDIGVNVFSITLGLYF